MSNVNKHQPLNCCAVNAVGLCSGRGVQSYRLCSQVFVFFIFVLPSVCQKIRATSSSLHTVSLFSIDDRFPHPVRCYVTSAFERALLNHRRGSFTMQFECSSPWSLTRLCLNASPYQILTDCACKRLQFTRFDNFVLLSKVTKKGCRLQWEGRHSLLINAK